MNIYIYVYIQMNIFIYVIFHNILYRHYATQCLNTYLFDMKCTCMLHITNKTLLLLYLARRAAPGFSRSHIQKQIDGSVGSHYAIALGLGTV